MNRTFFVYWESLLYNVIVFELVISCFSKTKSYRMQVTLIKSETSYFDFLDMCGLEVYRLLYLVIALSHMWHTGYCPSATSTEVMVLNGRVTI